MDTVPRLYDHSISVCIIGDSGVGKTSIIKRYTRDEFKYDTISTFGMDYDTHEVLMRKMKFQLQIWDTPGQQRLYGNIRLGNITKGGANVSIVVLVYDITDQNTFSVDFWLSGIKSSCGVSYDTTRFVLVGCKSDLSSGRMVSIEEGKKMAQKYKMLFIEVSAKSGDNIKELFGLCVQAYLTDMTQEKLVVTAKENMSLYLYDQKNPMRRSKFQYGVFLRTIQHHRCISANVWFDNHCFYVEKVKMNWYDWESIRKYIITGMSRVEYDETSKLAKFFVFQDEKGKDVDIVLRNYTLPSEFAANLELLFERFEKATFHDFNETYDLQAKYLVVTPLEKKGFQSLFVKEVINLRKFGESREHYTCLFESLRWAEDFREIDLSESNITDQEVGHLCECLNYNLSLKKLILKNTMITVMTCNIFSIALPVNLRFLSLAYTKIGNTGVKMILKSMKKNTRLIELDLSGTGATNHIVDTISSVFLSENPNRTLRRLVLWKNEFTTVGVLPLTKLDRIEALEIEFSMCRVDLEFQSIKYPHAKFNLCGDDEISLHDSLAL